MSNELVRITTHADDAEGRLPVQYKGKPNFVGLVRIAGDRAQVLEDILYDILTSGGITNGHDSLLDQVGDVVGQKRNGVDDTTYKALLIAKVAQNVSNGTRETLIRIYKLLMQADRVYFVDMYPAKFALNAIGDGVPLGSSDVIKAALNASRLGGVGIDYFSTSPAISFSFFGDPDPNGQGFGDATDATVGGYLAQAI